MKNLWLLWMALAAFIACVGQQEGDRPGQGVAAIAGNPTETDTECTPARWEAGACDVVLVLNQAASEGAFAPWYVAEYKGWAVSAEQPVRVWERGSIAGMPYRRTMRVWMRDLREMWQRVCGGAPAPCGIYVYYQTDVATSNLLSVVFGRNATGGPFWFWASYTTERVPGKDGSARVPEMYAVAYDTAAGAYGITQAARRMAEHDAAEGYRGRWLPNASGTSFATDFPAWSADE